MGARQKGTATPRADVGADTVNDKALTDRAQVVDTMATQTPLYLSNVAFKTEVDAYVAAGVALTTADTKVTNIEAALALARGDRDTARTTCKNCYAVVVSQVEKNSPTPAALQSYGFQYLDKVTQGAAIPTGIVWSFDHKTSLLHLHVQYAGKARPCLVEISPDPIGASTYHRLDGHGVRRTVAGYGPGTYWVHAATSIADGRSDWFGPVAVVIK